MANKQIDYRARGEEYPLIPRLMRHPVQNPRVPPLPFSLAFLMFAILIFMVAVVKAAAYRSGARCGVRHMFGTLVVLSTAAVIGYGFYQHFTCQ